ncbi:MAG: helix-turn-helix transcriptional regulator [Bacteroidaceae bacterium]|nr:helix-turn-helix transcriptional regulator [Bacteroidaceae bacterium]MBR1903114.1 helix-turn-helix transcriptional regulator [Bacteroidaceae bacterium]
MMHHPGNMPFDTANIKFAVIDSNVLTCIGLQHLLGRLLPMAEIQVFTNSKELMELGDLSGFLHFFVSSNIFFQQPNFFRQLPKKTIVLVNGDMQIKDFHTLNVCQSEKKLVGDIMALQHMGHDHAINLARQIDAKEVLSSREIEVAILLCKGYINKEIAEQLSLATTTVISHRKNIMEKIHARSLADVIIYCVIKGIVSIEEL